MNIKEFWPHFKKDPSSFKKKLLTLLIILTVAAGILTGSVVFINGQGSLMAITEAEIKREKDFINNYRQENEEFKKEYGNFTKLTAKDEIEKIQNNLLQKTKAHKLEVTSIQTLPSDDNQAVEFEMGFSGSWEEAVKFIRQIEANLDLISILSVSMNPKQNSATLIDVKLKYKIYTE